MRLDTLQRLLGRAADHPETGLRFLDRQEREDFWPWAAIGERSAAIAGGLARRGIVPGDRVALVFPTSPEFVVAFFGALLAGAVPVPLYPPVRLGRLSEYHLRTAAMLRAVDARLLLAERRILALLGETLELARPPLGASDLAGLPGGSRLSTDGHPEDLALIQFSSGTTVEPKPVALSQRAVLAHVLTLNAFWPDGGGVRHSGVSWLPLYHDMGLAGCVLPALERPSVLTLIPPEQFVARPALWLRAIARYRATISPAPNFAYALATERIADAELAGLDLSAWRIALCGAETVVPDVLRAFAARFARWGFDARALAPVYGLSEATLAVTFPRLGEGFTSARFDRAALAGEGRARTVGTAEAGREIVSVGRPIPGVELELRDASGALVGEERVGRIFVRSPALLSEYFGQPAATAAALREGWLDTGDLGFRFAGELYLTGRAKDILLVRGRNHAPADVELAVERVAGVRRGCAVAVSHLADGRDTEQVLLFVEHRRGLAASLHAELAEHCRGAVLTAVGLPVDDVFVLAPGTLPRTSSGKLRRGETLRQHLAGTLAPPARVNPLTLGLALLRSRLAGRRAVRRHG